MDENEHVRDLFPLLDDVKVQRDQSRGRNFYNSVFLSEDARKSKKKMTREISRKQQKRQKFYDPI